MWRAPCEKFASRRVIIAGPDKIDNVDIYLMDMSQQFTLRTNKTKIISNKFALLWGEAQ